MATARLLPMAFGLVALSLAAHAGGTGPSHDLPADPRAPLIVYDVRDRGPGPVDEAPLLVIRANGEVIAGRGAPAPTSRLTSEEVRRLLNFILVEHDFLRLDAAKIIAAVREAQRRGGLVVAIDGAKTTVVRLNLRNRTHEVAFYALSDMAEYYPEVASLQSLRAIARRLERLAAK